VGRLSLTQVYHLMAHETVIVLLHELCITVRGSDDGSEESHGLPILAEPEGIDDNGHEGNGAGTPDVKKETENTKRIDHCLLTIDCDYGTKVAFIWELAKFSQIFFVYQENLTYLCRAMTQEQDIKNAVEVLRRGGIILYPTDTIWGIGCDATNEQAVQRVYEIKQRDDSKSLICLVDSDARLQRYVRNVPDVAWQLIDCLKEDTSECNGKRQRPTTLILDGAVNLAPNLIATDGSIGIRITQEQFSRELCFRFQKAIVSTSANISGEPAAQNFKDIDPRIIDQVDYVCWSRRQEHKPHDPSAIIKIGSDGEVKLIR